MSPADRQQAKYEMNNDRVVGFYKKVLTDLRGTIQKERKGVQKYLQWIIANIEKAYKKHNKFTFT